MTTRKADRKWAWYVCGKCKHKIYYLKNEEKPYCNECGAVYSGTTSSTSNTTTGGASGGGDLVEIKEYMHFERDNHDVPSEIKIDLNNPNG